MAIHTEQDQDRKTMNKMIHRMMLKILHTKNHTKILMIQDLNFELIDSENVTDSM